MPVEVWAGIEGYLGRYEVSNFGNVRSLPHNVYAGRGRQRLATGKLLKLQKNTHGYPQVNLASKTHVVHRLVANAFLCKDEGLFNQCKTNFHGVTVNHIDGDITNNCVENLEYISQEGNLKHSRDVLGNDAVGENNPQSKLTVEDVKVLKVALSLGYSREDIANYLHISKGTVSDISLGKGWKHVNVEDSVAYNTQTLAEIRQVLHG